MRLIIKLWLFLAILLNFLPGASATDCSFTLDLELQEALEAYRKAFPQYVVSATELEAMSPGEALDLTSRFYTLVYRTGDIRRVLEGPMKVIVQRIQASNVQRTEPIAVFKTDGTHFQGLFQNIGSDYLAVNTGGALRSTSVFGLTDGTVEALLIPSSNADPSLMKYKLLYPKLKAMTLDHKSHTKIFLKHGKESPHFQLATKSWKKLQELHRELFLEMSALAQRVSDKHLGQTVKLRTFEGQELEGAILRIGLDPFDPMDAVTIDFFVNGKTEVISVFEIEALSLIPLL